MKNKMILIGGYCATGKSTFSNKLGQILNIPCFNKDTIKEVMADGIGSENQEAITKLSATTCSLMLHIAEKLLQQRNMLILESNFRLSEGEQIKALIEKYNCDCLTFVFNGDLDILYERYVERDNTAARHWVHKSAESRDDFKNGNLQLANRSFM